MNGTPSARPAGCSRLICRRMGLAPELAFEGRVQLCPARPAQCVELHVSRILIRRSSKTRRPVILRFDLCSTASSGRAPHERFVFSQRTKSERSKLAGGSAFGAARLVLWLADLRDAHRKPARAACNQSCNPHVCIVTAVLLQTDPK